MAYESQLWNRIPIGPAGNEVFEQCKKHHSEGLMSMRSDAPETPIVLLLRGWLMYADRHATRYQSGIGEDGVLGPAWQTIGEGIRDLLNGECGKLDCGTLDAILVGTLTEEGFIEE